MTGPSQKDAIPVNNSKAGREKDQAKAYTLADFAYDLPDELIASEPAAVRHESRLLVIERETGKLSHRRFADLVDLLIPGDVLVVNDTRVIPARITCLRTTGGAVELLLLRPDSERAGLWHAMATPLRKLKAGEKLLVHDASGKQHEITISEIYALPDGQKRALVDLGPGANTYNLLTAIGNAPLPPYILKQREKEQHTDEITESERQHDIERYQTVFAREPGAVAAPTAGLHFSDEVLAKLQACGIEVAKVTLHVGPGTFKPITSSLEEHTIETESFSIPEHTAATINKALSEGRRIIAVGTTSCRALETAGTSRHVTPVSNGQTGLYISPGYQFKIISGLVTNFHLSQSSLLVLVSAFAGRDVIMAAYQEAIAQRYRFFSYGDATLIL